MTFTELPQRWKIVVDGRRHELSLAEITDLRTACDEVLEHRSRCVDQVVKLICEKFGIERYELFSDSRPNHICIPRFCAWTLLGNRGLSQSEIARQFKVHHTTVNSGLKSLEKKLEDNDQLRKQLVWMKNGEK